MHHWPVILNVMLFDESPFISSSVLAITNRCRELSFMYILYMRVCICGVITSLCVRVCTVGVFFRWDIVSKSDKDTEATTYCCICDPQEKKKKVNLDAGWANSACKQLLLGNLRCKQIRTNPYHRYLSIWASGWGKELLTGLRLAWSPFTKQTEGLDRYVTNVIREGYHPSSCAFNETPLTMWPCTAPAHFFFSLLQALQWAPNSENTICSWNGICRISSDVPQFENLNS